MWAIFRPLSTKQTKPIPYAGTVEIKENKSGKYLYMRIRELGRLTSFYVDGYSDELYQTLPGYSKEARKLQTQIRAAPSSAVYPVIGLNLEFAGAKASAERHREHVRLM